MPLFSHKFLSAEQSIWPKWNSFSFSDGPNSSTKLFHVGSNAIQWVQLGE